MSDRSKVSAAYRTLRKLGYFAKHDYWCCSSCAMAALNDDCPGEQWAFYHAQDGMAFDRKGNLNGASLDVRWGGDAPTIVCAFEDAGLRVEWGGKDSQTIRVIGEGEAKPFTRDLGKTIEVMQRAALGELY